jgi:glycosyltransferase involved in cell wall biosynthesis
MKRGLVLMAHPGHGGIMRSLAALDRAAPRFGWELRFAFPAATAQVAATGLDRGARYVAGLNRWRRASGLARLPIVLSTLVREVRQRDVDLVYCATLSSFPLGLLTARICRVGEIVHFYSSYGDAAPYRKYWLARARHAIAPSRDSLECARAAIGSFGGRTEVIYNGIDLPDIVAAAGAAPPPQGIVLPPGPPTIGMVAYMDRRKNPMALVEVAARLAPRIPDVRVLLIGEFPDPAYRAAVQARAKELNLGGNLLLAGFQVNPFPLVAACDVIALPAQRDPFPIALLEAMALGKPIVANAVGGIPEMIAAGTTGFVVPPDDLDAFAAAVLRLLEDRQLRDTVGRAARRRLETCFSVEGFVGRMFAAFESAGARR